MPIAGAAVFSDGLRQAALPRLAETLVGRVESTLFGPFPQGRLSVAGNLRRPVFAPTFEIPQSSSPTETNVFERLLVGGYPGSRCPQEADRRYAWFDSYVTTILTQERAGLGKHREDHRNPALTRTAGLTACRIGELRGPVTLAGHSPEHFEAIFALLEATFLVRLLPAWFANIGKRLTKSPKLLISDTGLATYLLDLNLQRLQRDRGLLGHLLENFVAMELIKQTGWATTRVKPYHFRTESGQEVDLVLEDAAGRIAGIEIKAAVSLDAHDLRGLKTLAELSGKRFLRGIVFYLGEAVVPLGKDLWAVPVSMAWK